MKKLVGKVTEEEKLEIKSLYFKKKSLEELFSILLTSSLEIKNQEVYDKMMTDYTSVTEKFEDWWKVKSVMHSWENVPGGNWEINFETNEIFVNYS